MVVMLRFLLPCWPIVPLPRDLRLSPLTKLHLEKDELNRETLESRILFPFSPPATPAADQTDGTLGLFEQVLLILREHQVVLHLDHDDVMAVMVVVMVLTITLLHDVIPSINSSSSSRLSGKSMSAIPSSEMQVSSGFLKSSMWSREL